MACIKVFQACITLYTTVLFPNEKNLLTIIHHLRHYALILVPFCFWFRDIHLPLVRILRSFVSQRHCCFRSNLGMKIGWNQTQIIWKRFRNFQISCTTNTISFWKRKWWKNLNTINTTSTSIIACYLILDVRKTNSVHCG